MPRLAALTIAFRQPPAETEGDSLVSIEPPRAGSFVWLDERTLLFQPDYPGWARGQDYEVVLDGLAAGLADEYTHTFTAEGGLEVDYVIPGDGDTEVPARAQILVQFNRSVAALTVLQEGPAAAVLEIDPPLEGQGEWLNTSLYRFIPTEAGAKHRVLGAHPRGTDLSRRRCARSRLHLELLHHPAGDLALRAEE